MIIHKLNIPEDLYNLIKVHCDDYNEEFERNISNEQFILKILYKYFNIEYCPFNDKDEYLNNLINKAVDKLNGEN